MTTGKKSMVNRVTVACGVSMLMTSGVLAEACGGDDASVNPTDAGADGTFDSGSGGDSGSRDSGGGDSSSRDSGGDAGLWCGVEADGGTLCARFDWLDSDSGTCLACPSSTFHCAALVQGVGASSAPTFEAGAREITTQLAPGTAQIMSGTITIPLSACFGAPASFDGGVVTLPLTVNGDTLTTPPVPLPDGAPAFDYTPCGVMTYVLTDSCCTSHTVQVTSYFNSEGNINNSFCDAGE